MTYLRDQAYRFYIADELYYHARNQTHTDHIRDLLYPKKQDNRTAEEIVADIVSRAGLEIVNDEFI